MLDIILFFCSNETATTDIYPYGHTLSLHVALPISLDPRGHVDAVTFVESHESLLHVGALADLAAEALRLALVAQRVDGLHLHLEDLLHCRLDLRLAGIQRHHEGDLVVLGAERRLLGHHRSADQDRKSVV